jgi:hypothetical protein
VKAQNKTLLGRRGTGAALVLAVSLALFTSTAWALELATVLEKTAVSPPARVKFREERHNRMLKEALVLTGYLEYLGEGRLRKVVETPFRESFFVDGERIEVSRDGEVRTTTLSRSKALRTMLGGIEAILAGQTGKLESIFRYTISGTSDNWSLDLTPRSRQVLRHLNGLTVVGDESSVISIGFDLNDGEWHRLEIRPDLPQQ